MSQSMQKASLVGTVVVTLSLVVFRAEAENPPAADSATVEQLLQRISDLEDRIDLLEARFDRQPVLHYTTPQVVPEARVDPLLKYRRGEINGIPYHMMPIDAQTEPRQSTTLPLPQRVEGGEPHRVEGGQ